MKQSPPSFNQRLLKLYHLQQKRNPAGEMDKSRIAWSRLGNKHTDALMGYDSDTDVDDHNIVVENANNVAGNLTNQPAASVVNNYSGNSYCNVKVIISHVCHKYSIIKHVITINSMLLRQYSVVILIATVHLLYE
jgi:hypothetical protein